MDFFSRLLRRQPAEQRPQSGPTPQQRYLRFKKIYNELLRIWNNGKGASKDAFAAENHRLLINRIRELLASDARGPTPHLCISFAFTNGILRTLTQIGTAFCEPGIASEVIGVMQLVVDSEEEAFLEDRGFADALPIFVEAVKMDLLGRVWTKREEQTEGVLDRDGGLEARMVEVLFGVTSAIRTRPLVLKVWFRPEQFFDDADELTEDDQPSRLEEFPLFYALITYLTQEGRAGDFARMGILYIVESTSYSPPLERWLVEGDMAALVTSVLGGLFSQLGTKLALTYSDEEQPAMLKFSSRIEKDLAYDVEATSSQEYADHIRSFLANLMFWQDILEHCTSREVKQTLLDHFQHIFLQKLLYPSLVGSSEAGSVAVLTYLRNILESVSHYDLVHRMLVYLFGLPAPIQPSAEPASPVAKARRRKSEILLVRNAADDDDQPTPELFNLSDLVNNGLIAPDHDTITCTLRLLSTLLKRHHQESLPHILQTRRAYSSDLTRTLGGHEKEIDNWIALAGNLTSFQDLEQSYERAIYDSKNLLEHHICTYPIMHIRMPGVDNTERWSPIEPYVLLPEDPISMSLLNLLDTFLTNDIETNLCLTGVFTDLAACGNMRLEGWLLTEPARYVYQGDKEVDETAKGASTKDSSQSENGDAMEEAEGSRQAMLDETAIEDDVEEEEGNQDQERQGNTEDDDPNIEDNPDEVNAKRLRAREEPAWHGKHASPVFKSLDNLLTKVESFHRQLQDFDALLAECKKEVIPQSVHAPPSNSVSPLPMATPMSRDPSTLIQTSPGAASYYSGPSSPALRASTPSRGHVRSGSIVDRVAGFLGTSPGKNGSGMNPSSLAPSSAARLQLRLSEASSPASMRSKGAASRNRKEVSPVSIGSLPKRGLPHRGHSRHASLQEALLETPTPKHPRKRALRGDDLGASPSPRLDRRVVPGSGRDGEQGSSLRNALSSDSDSDSDGDVSISDIDDEASVKILDVSDSDEDIEEGARAQFGKTVDVDDSDITVGHLLTNVIILQEFVLEMAALISVRASYFGEVRFE